MRRVVGLLVACALTLGACRGEARQTQAKSEQDLARLVDSLRGPVERATGLRFTSPPRSAMRSKDQVRAYLIRKRRAAPA